MSETREIVEWVDPDWRDHFTDAEQAAEFYRTYSPVVWQQAVKEMDDE